MKLKQKCDEENIIFLSTPENISDLKFLMELGMKAIKIGSDDFTNIPLLRDYAKTELPLIISCGMADLDEIKNTLSNSLILQFIFSCIIFSFLFFFKPGIIFIRNQTHS